jgi:hypothetical protein
VRDVHEHAAAAAGTAALVRIAPARESRGENFLAESQVRDVVEMVVPEGQGRLDT